MKKNLIVLTDFSPAAERARAYAAELALELGAVVHLVHVRPGGALHASQAHEVRQVQESLERAAAAMPVPATATTLTDLWDDAVPFALSKYRPLLVVAGLTAVGSALHQWMSNRTLPLAQQSGYPVLLVPAHLPKSALRTPRYIALAVRDQPFSLTPQSAALVPQLHALRAVIVPLTVVTPSAPEGGEKSLQAVQRWGLVADHSPTRLHRVVDEDVVTGILQGIKELSADVVALLDPGHGWVFKLFVGSVIDEITRTTPVPVLLLATQVEA